MDIYKPWDETDVFLKAPAIENRSNRSWVAVTAARVGQYVYAYAIEEERIPEEMKDSRFFRSSKVSPPHWVFEDLPGNNAPSTTGTLSFASDNILRFCLVWLCYSEDIGFFLRN